jgi:hypothetical protein
MLAIRNRGAAFALLPFSFSSLSGVAVVVVFELTISLRGDNETLRRLPLPASRQHATNLVIRQRVELAALLWRVSHDKQTWLSLFDL